MQPIQMMGVAVDEGDVVREGDLVLLLEAMKLEIHVVELTGDG